MEFTRIILRPVHTEKTTALLDRKGKTKVITVAVDPKAKKTDIKIAFESIYGVKPIKVCTKRSKPSNVRTGTKYPGMTKLTKIAYVYIASNAKIEGVDNTIDESVVEQSKPVTPITAETVNAEVVKKEVTKKAETKEDNK